jgi:serralysin
MADVPNDTTTGATLVDGGFVIGEIDSIGDVDWLRVEVAAGETWKFFWNSESYEAGVGADLRILDAGGNVIFGLANSGDDSWIWLKWQFAAGGTYYISVGGMNALPGGYQVSANMLTDSPLEAIDWGTALPADTPIEVYFAAPGETYETDLGPMHSMGWSDYLVGRVMAGFAAYEAVANLTFRQTAVKGDAELKLVQYDNTDGDFPSVFGFFSPPAYTYAGVAGFNGLNPFLTPVPGGNIEAGGRYFEALVHEIGHALGLAHPHDQDNASVIMNGVQAATGPSSYGAFELNQGIFTVMSYNYSWTAGPLGLPLAQDGTLDRSFGYAAGPMALDIALIQQKYGANTSYHTGDDLYVLPVANGAGTAYLCIWDAGGADTISAAGADGAIIDLRAASLAYEAGGGGWVSWASGIHGGFTIANKVMIEAAIGSAGDDRITGNAGANRIEGAAGSDTLSGGAGNDSFVFDFALAETTVWFRPNDGATGGTTPSLAAGAAAWRAYTEQLAAWRTALEALHGSDADVGTRAATVKDGRGTATFAYDNSFSWVTSVTGEGEDVIADWEQGSDRLVFNGVTKSAFLNMLSSGLVTVEAEVDVAGSNALDTVIAWDSSSITLADVSLTASSLMNAGFLFA